MNLSKLQYLLRENHDYGKRSNASWTLGLPARARANEVSEEGVEHGREITKNHKKFRLLGRSFFCLFSDGFLRSLSECIFSDSRYFFDVFS